MRPITPYIIAVCLEHVYPSLLSISKTAAYEPEGSIFGFLMSFVALSGLLKIFFLENEGSFKLDLRLFTKVQRLNKVSVPFGCSCIVGLLVVLNFRSRARIIPIGKVDDAGTPLFFVTGAIYYLFQTLITFYGVKVGLNTKCMFFLLFAVSCAITLTGVGFPFFKLFSYTKFHGSNDIAHWKLNDGGYSLHLLNCLGECITCFILAFYQMSYHKDCQTFSIEVCCVENNGKKIYQPDNKLHECEQIKQVDEREEPEY